MRRDFVRVELDKTILDLGFTPVENMFIHTYMSLANGDQIKVYLYALSQAYATNGDGITNENIAFEMGLSVGQVIDAWQFWQEKGLVEIKGDSYIFKSLRSGYISELIGIEEEEPARSKLKQGPVTNKYYNDSFKELIQNIEDFISSDSDIEIKLIPREIDLIDSLIKDFHLTYDYFTYAFQLASIEVASKNVAKLCGVIRNWAIDGAKDEASLDLLMNKKEAAKKQGQKRRASKKAKLDEDDRMSREERKRFIEEKMKKQSFLPRE